MSGENPEEPRPGNYDRAWNDPPLLGFSTDANKSSGPTGLKLNQRVGFSSFAPPPAGMANPSTSSAPPMTAKRDAGAKPDFAKSMPPPPPPTAKGSNLSMNPQQNIPEQENPKDEGEEEVSLEDVISALKDCLEKADIEGAKRQDIQKRITVMEKAWRNEELNPRIRKRIKIISNLIANSKYEEAEKAQLSLAVDWPECASWLIGIKHLILSFISKE